MKPEGAEELDRIAGPEAPPAEREGDLLALVATAAAAAAGRRFVGTWTFSLPPQQLLHFRTCKASAKDTP